MDGRSDMTEERLAKGVTHFAKIDEKIAESMFIKKTQMSSVS